MLDNKYSGEDIEVVIGDQDFMLTNVEWNTGSSPVVADLGDHGLEYGDPEFYEFVCGYIGSFRVNRDALIEMSSKTEVESLEQGRWEKEVKA